MKHILILGGDGYLGWPTAMYFSNHGYQVTVVDNYFRRKACDDLNSTILFPIPNLFERARIWNEKTGYKINVIIGDLSDPEFTRSLLDPSQNSSDWIQPETVIHYAEQPSAPYSLINYQYADITLINNLRVTNNILWAIRDYARDVHLIKLGTMGEYGTPNIDIEEGWIDIKHKGRSDKFLYPRQAGSLYHTTKIMDTDLLWFAVRMWNLKVTDLMQGPVYGVETEESKIDDRLRTIFNYDEIFGTIINRFVVQSVVDYPLTVYGKGGQTRGYINIKDTLQCVHKSEITPASSGELRIFNQITETFSVNQLANMIQEVGVQRGHDVQIKHIENPRKEMENHYYNPSYQGLSEIGVKPTLLSGGILNDLFKVVEEKKKSINKDIIFKGIKWD